MDVLPQLIASGLAVGSLYALMAVGFVLIFKTTDVVNFAHGDMAMVSTFVALMALRSWSWPFWAALGAAVVTGFLVGALANLLLRPAVSRGASVFSLMIATLGISMMINALAGNFFGYQPQSFPPLIRGRPFVLFDVVRITPHNALVFGMAGALALTLFAILKYTRLGTAMRAMAQNSRAALLMGVNVRNVSILAWGIGAAMGAIAGVLVAPAPGVNLSLNSMVLVLIKGFAAAVLGGFTSLPGAFVGGLIVGVVENLLGFYVSTQFQTTFVFLLIVVVLAVRPRGLLGAPVAGRRA